MMDEERILNGIYSDSSINPKTCPDYVRYQNFKMLSKPNELNEIVLEKDGDFDIFNTHLDVLDTYLIEKFKLTVYDFMRIYTEHHVQNGFSFPITTPYITCLFKKESDPMALSEFLREYQSVIPSQGMNLGVPNLHDGTIYVFTLIEADFDVHKYNRSFPGYYYMSSTCPMNIGSSKQFDITVVYEAPKQS